MEINIDIEGAVSTAVANALTPEKLQPIISRNVEQVVKEAIDEQFGYRSEFKKLLSAKIAEAMPTDIEDLGRYGDLVLKTVAGYFNQLQLDSVRSTIEAKLADMVRALPGKIKLSELVSMLLADLAEAYDRRGSSQPTVIVELNDTLAGYWCLFIDPSDGTSKYSCGIQAAFSPEGKCYSLKVNGDDLQKKLLIGPVFNADALFLNLYTNGIVVELDQDDFSDVYYPDSED